MENEITCLGKESNSRPPAHVAHAQATRIRRSKTTNNPINHCTYFQLLPKYAATHNIGGDTYYLQVNPKDLNEIVFFKQAFTLNLDNTRSSVICYTTTKLFLLYDI